MELRKRSYDSALRAAKAAATRERILDCAVDLYRRNGALDLTLDDVATGAGVSVQTVLRGFSSKEDLLLATMGRLGRLGAEWIRATDVGDVDAAVAALFDVYESIGDLVIRQLGDEVRFPTLRPALDEGRANHRAWIANLFAPQLSARSETDKDETFRLLDVATDVYVWKLLRRDMGIERASAESAMRRMIRGALETENEHGEDSMAELVRRRESPAQPRRRAHRR